MSNRAVAVSIYVFLLLLFAVMLFAAEHVGPTMRQTISPLAADALKTVLGALIGALSVLWREDK